MPPPSSASARDTTASESSVAVGGVAGDVHIHQGVSGEELRGEVRREVERQLAALKGNLASTPSGAQPVDTDALAAAATPGRTERQLARALEFQAQHREREAIAALLAAFEENIPPLARAQLHLLIGNSFLNLSELVQAEGHYRQALDAARAAGSKEAEAAALGNLGLVYRRRGDLDGAEEHHRRALALHEEIGNRLGEANALGNLGLVYANRGDRAQARRHYAQALRLFEEIGAQQEIEIVRGNLAALDDAPAPD